MHDQADWFNILCCLFFGRGREGGRERERESEREREREREELIFSTQSAKKSRILAKQNPSDHNLKFYALIMTHRTLYLKRIGKI